MTGPPAAEDVVACEAVIPAPPEEVFRWFVRPELLVRWIGIDARLEPWPGGLFRFEISDGQWCSGRYLEVVPGRRVVVTWGWESGAIPVPPGSSTVTVELSEHPGGTLVHLVHSGLAPELRPCTPRAGRGFCPAWPRSWPGATRARTRPTAGCRRPCDPERKELPWPSTSPPPPASTARVTRLRPICGTRPTTPPGSAASAAPGC